MYTNQPVVGIVILKSNVPARSVLTNFSWPHYRADKELGVNMRSQHGEVNMRSQHGEVNGDSGKWKVESGDWRVESGEWRLENGER